MPFSTFSSMAHQNFTGKSTSFNYIKNFNFASSIGTGWTTQGLVVIDNGTSGVYGFASCPYIKIAVNQAYPGFAAGLLTQSVNLFASSYVLSFWAAVRPGGAYYNAAHQVSVSIDGTTYFTSSFTTSNTTWTQYFVYFSVASAGSHTVSFNFTTAGSNDSSIGITQVLVNNSFANYNFALPAQAANTYANYHTPNTITNWTHNGYMKIANGTGGGFAFSTCPFGQFLINQCYSPDGTINGSISQIFYLSATTYTLSFWAAVRPGGYDPAQQVSVLVDDTTCYTSSFTTSSTAWTQYTFDFTVQVTGLHTIYIKFILPSTVTADTSIGITQISVYYNNNTYGSIYNSFIPAPSSSGNFSNTLTTYSGKMLIFPTITEGNPSSTILTGIYTTITGITGTQSFMNGTYIANDSGNYGPVWTAFNLFNSSTETGFHSPSATYSATDGTYTGSKSQTISGTVVFGEWMTIQFPYRFVLTSYTTTVRFGYDAVRAPSTWKVGGSNDGTTWTLLDTRTNITTGVNTFSVSTTTQYSYYVIVVSKITGLDGYLNFAEWTLYGTKTIDVTIPSILSYQLTNSALDKLRGLYAFRQCIFTYTGPVVNVRRASDSATSDFYADLSGNIGQGVGGTGTTLLSWLTSTTGYVTKWYDQSSQANHLVQATAANQPQIILNDWGGICLYLNTAISGSQLQTINNMFSTSTVTDAHVFFNAKALSYTVNVTFSLNSPVSYGVNRFGGHLPFSDGIYYFDTGDQYARSTSLSNIVVPGTKSYFSGYKQSSTTSQGFNINNYKYSTASNPSVTVSYLGLNFSDGNYKTNHYMYAFAVFSKSLYNSADETFLMNYFKVYVPAQYAALYAIYRNKQPWGIYDADKWNSSTNVLPDIRGWGRDATSGGTITKGSGAGNGATSAVAYITGSTASSLTWPSGSIPTNFTICSVTRYTGGTSRRILNGTSNWLHGHWNGQRGVCHYDNWKTNSTGVGTLNNWLVCCGKNSGSTPNNILIDSVASGTATGGSSNQQLFINAGGGNYGETTDFQLSYLIIWDQILTDAEMLTTSNALLYYLSSGIPFEIPLVYDGLTAATAAPSAAYLTTWNTTSTNNGVYWINLPTVGPTQVYCILDYAVDGGGWMMAMKATRGTTFPYSSSYWTTNNTLNPSDANRNDGDAKFNTMNYYPAKDMLALWPDITTVGGTLSLSSYGCWCWSRNGAVGSQPLINYFSTASNVVFDSNPRAGKERGSVFSSQGGNQFYGVNFTQRGGDEVRWGFAWNNETDWGSNDVRGGIGLAANAYSAGDNIGCCQDQTGINRTARVEVYVR